MKAKRIGKDDCIELTVLEARTLNILGFVLEINNGEVWSITHERKENGSNVCVNGCANT